MANWHCALAAGILASIAMPSVGSNISANSINAVEATETCVGNETGVQKPNVHGLCYCPLSLFVGFSCGTDGRDYDFYCYGTATEKNAYLDAGNKSGKSSLTDNDGTCRLYCL